MTEQQFILLAFLLIGVVVGYFAFLTFRISVEQRKFEWSGALEVITALAGGGFLSYWSTPRNFAAYGIGFFLGFLSYWISLQFPKMRRGSQAASASVSRPAPAYLSLGSQAASASASRPEDEYHDSRDTNDQPSDIGFRIPLSVNALFALLSDATVPTERRVRASLEFFRTEKDGHPITIESPLDDLPLSNRHLLCALLVLKLSSSEPTLFSDLLELRTVKDVVDLVDAKTKHGTTN